MGARFRLNPGWEAEIEKAVEPAIAEAAEAASDAARGLSPVDTGDYSGSHVHDDTSFGSTDPASHLIEFGYGGTPAHRPLTGGAEAVGLRFEPEGGTLS